MGAKYVLGIEIVLAGFVDDANVLRLLRLGVWQQLVNFAALSDTS